MPLYNSSMLWLGCGNPAFIKGEYKKEAFLTAKDFITAAHSVRVCV